MRGYSLAEVLIATFLVATAVLGLISARLYSVQAERGASQRYEVTAAAGSVLASIESDLQQRPENFAKSYAVTDQGYPNLRDAVYSVEEDSPEPGLRKFTVTVRQHEQSYKLWTLVGRP